MSADLDEMYHGVFVTALEGGIGYWSVAEDYRWSTGDGQTEDHKGFRAVIRETTDEEEGPELVVDRRVVARGLRALAAHKVTWGGRPMSPESRWPSLAKGWLRDPANADIDADAADNIIQAGLFGDIRYG